MKMLAKPSLDGVTPIITIFFFFFFPASVTKPLSAYPTKWSNTLKQLVGRLPTTNCLSVFDHLWD